MTSVARNGFLRAVEAFALAADTAEIRASDDRGALLRRGLTVAGFNLLETFIASRMQEVADYLNAGELQFGELPEKLQSLAIRNTLRVATTRSRRMSQAAPADLRVFARDVGQSLSAVEHSLRLSPMT